MRYTSNMALRAAILELESYDVDAAPILTQVGVERFMDPDRVERVALGTVHRFLQLAQEATGDPCFGLDYGKFIRPTTFGALGIALLSSTDLADFCTRLCRYYEFIATNHSLSFESANGQTWVEIKSEVHNLEPEVSRSIINAIISMMLKFIREISDHQYAPPRIEMIATRIEGTEQRYIDSFGTAVIFSANKNALYFDRQVLHTPLSAGDRGLARSNEELVEKYLEKVKKDDLSFQVYDALLQALPSGNVSKETMADRFAMSLTAFHNHLLKAGTSFQKLLDEARRELAEIYFEKNMSITDVAFMLGYSDSSNFTRAYKRWTGKAPSRNNPTAN